APIRQIAQNARAESTVVLHKVSKLTGSFGYNADSGEYTDLVADGVIDPTKVTRTALQNAASVARVLLSTDCLITEKPKEKNGNGAAGMGDDGMADMDMM
ncbi:MAG: chaperonin GroEL, partial [Planctomycetes bacterium]|nr:chaperonin GroEL [Planctomycetota bacterium]